ncbi:MAG: hypothetical protein KAS87_02090 [Candidatus Omnitrophica bacterium]|nr:hypothetical protein [Candidatus Omnitrophota bacterium]
MKRIIAISICVVFVLSASMVPLAQEKKEEEIGMTFKEFQEEVRDLIVARNAILLHRFNKKDYHRMARKFAPQAMITTHENIPIPGKASENYWRTVGIKLQGKNLQFELGKLKFYKLPVSDPDDQEAVNYVAWEITKFSFETTSSGKIEVVHKHRVICEID